MPKDPFAKMLAGEMEYEEESEPMRIPLPRVFRAYTSEIGNQDQEPGKPITLKIYGTVKMVDDEGCIFVNVTRVEGDKEEKKEQAFKESNVIYKPTEMPSPS